MSFLKMLRLCKSVLMILCAGKRRAPGQPRLERV